MIELRDAFGTEVNVDDEVYWRTRKGFQRGTITQVTLKMDRSYTLDKNIGRYVWGDRKLVTRILVTPKEGYQNPRNVKVFIKA